MEWYRDHGIEEKFMKRHIQNLQRLLQELQTRYGNDDELVVQLTHEIEVLQTRESTLTKGWHHDRRKQEWRASPVTVQ